MDRQEARWDGFDWDAGNEDKLIRRHGISRKIVEYALGRPHLRKADPTHSRNEPRWVAISADDHGRPLFVVYTVRMKDGQMLCRPLSARYMHAKEARAYVEKEA